MDKETLINKLLHINPTLHRDILEDFSRDVLEKAYTELLEERSENIRELTIGI
ncbi:hypothetical protein ACNAN0_02335 [Agrilactobacillus fermenti]|uniref:hypothetical protein n=1 Tax=Agrilactobacillus fermenti TaxID=2586909 RepID=UPI001E62BC76|nr:hypothetical protein [Agrilactobacillus fermenti]MCD2257107.1 hypothetical protein [Agrilactobacillus fermenti]